MTLLGFTSDQFGGAFEGSADVEAAEEDAGRETARVRVRELRVTWVLAGAGGGVGSVGAGVCGTGVGGGSGDGFRRDALV